MGKLALFLPALHLPVGWRRNQCSLEGSFTTICMDFNSCFGRVRELWGAPRSSESVGPRSTGTSSASYTSVLPPLALSPETGIMPMNTSVLTPAYNRLPTRGLNFCWCKQLMGTFSSISGVIGCLLFTWTVCSFDSFLRCWGLKLGMCTYIFFFKKFVSAFCVAQLLKHKMKTDTLVTTLNSGFSSSGLNYATNK